MLKFGSKAKLINTLVMKPMLVFSRTKGNQRLMSIICISLFTKMYHIQKATTFFFFCSVLIFLLVT